MMPNNSLTIKVIFLYHIFGNKLAFMYMGRICSLTKQIPRGFHLTITPAYNRFSFTEFTPHLLWIFFFLATFVFPVLWTKALLWFPPFLYKILINNYWISKAPGSWTFGIILSDVNRTMTMNLKTYKTAWFISLSLSFFPSFFPPSFSFPPSFFLSFSLFLSWIGICSTAHVCKERRWDVIYLLNYRSYRQSAEKSVKRKGRCLTVS